MPLEKPARILLVEDDAAQRRILELFLKQHGHQVASVASVAEALTAIQQRLPDALVLDAMLPDGSGLDVCRQTRALPTGAALPILLVTAYDTESVIAEAFEAGVTDFIAKPINLHLFGRRLQRLIHVARSDAILKARERQFRTLVDSLPDIVIRGQHDGTVTYFKPSDTCPPEMFGLVLTPQTSVADILPPEGASLLKRAIANLTSGAQQVAEYRALCHGKWCEFEARVIPDEESAFVAIIRDVTERKTAERLREDFTAMVAHDIRSPLTAMQMALDFFERYDTQPDEALQEVITVARQGLNKVLQLASDLLELFRANQTGMTLLKGVVFPATLIQRCIREASLPAQQKGISLAVEVAEDLPPFVGDAPKLERVFSNLLSNAVKFTPEGGRITVCGVADGEWVVIRIADTGQGIPPEMQAAMFEPYRQGSGRTSLGFGLGLAIVKRIVTAHRGRISVESTVGQGTTFTVRLPLQVG
ncbi:response regulator [Chloracidobacterium validum]|uniref:histidine kinase n=1 Tax=Chloracidobacterium validum TaxID=2821543 RepID=A0ABX8BCZ5_9BACT|nr:ATP-binding protein [Chloracidobacterium validum]QUW04683.1 response regulator [Chloracidobacterium validum]